MIDSMPVMAWRCRPVDLVLRQFVPIMGSTMKVADHGPDVASLPALIDSLPALIHTGRPDGYLDFFNQRWLQFVGLRLEELEGWKWTSAVHRDDVAALIARWRACLASGEPLEFEARVRRADGEYRWMLHHKVAVRDESGHIVKWYGSSVEIEDRKQAEFKVSGSEAKLRRIIDTIPSLAWSTLPDGSGEFWNKRWYDYTGLTPEECLGLGWHRGVHPEDVTPLMNKWAEVLASGEAGEGEARFRRHDGVFRWFLIRAEPLRDETGKIVSWYGISTDIEERRQAEQKLRQVLEEIRGSEANLRRTIDTIPALVSGFLPDGSNEFMNQRWHDYTGLSPEDSQHGGWQQPVHADDLPPLMERFRQARATGEPGDIETRLRRRDGVFRWFVVRAEPLRDDAGKVVKWYATSTDIEDRKQAEEKLRQDERELRQITDAIAQTIVVNDVDGTPIYANKAVLDYTGLTIDDVTRPDFQSRIVHPEDFERLRHIRLAAFLRGLPFEFELRVLSKNGQYRWFLNHYNPFRDEQGRVTRWYTTGTDIEDRKRAEDRTKNENVALREEIDHASMFEEIVGSSDAIRQVLEQVTKVAPTDSTVLISGETGTGKELIARAIHKRSNRAARAFIRVNCGAIASSLIASELFGHEKGAFTGAFQRRIGHFEAADGGTIFLDEIGDLPVEMQSALLRVLQEEEFQRVGSSQSVSIDVRVLAATNSDLRSAVAAGRFREDLFYRLNVFPICLPPLRERPEDIPLLVEYLVTRYAQKAGKKFRDITSKTLQLFQTYRWPGNIRELQNVIERAIVLCDGDTFSIDDRWLGQESSLASGPVAPLLTTLEDRERQMIEEALAQSRGRISGPTGAAVRLGIPRQTLDRKIMSLGIDKNQFKSH
jgi:formate hydrogenlyase transcriptional activator